MPEPTTASLNTERPPQPPTDRPEVPGYQFYAYYEPAQEVGGDYYDFVPLTLPSPPESGEERKVRGLPPEQQRLAIMLGDVAGKGVPAALLMAKLSSDARFCLLSQANLAAAITVLNDLLYQHTSQMDRFVTLGGAVLDPATHEVTLVSAGHLSPLMFCKAKGQ